ncbi:DUF3072 domain-containing protein [Bradyrhizobium sp. ISRA432]|nr:DUF3072 domain-containing protein [Bradyrhizobium sp. ISRA426]WGR77485.1 DUF3072 domain-containing protein [Bradyrhizobium sp. ISRA430]WGR87891.1 DUF3072 domain-containing protein [Bradyrhizobium sp. ISRA432]
MSTKESATNSQKDPVRDEPMTAQASYVQTLSEQAH